ncbi:hypothetical protein HHK36_011094 [Tetracentron sinense]|uniref:Bifunctional inhibitor/plant lipid transfer protein/seed storage helical domain-containing protein n=1 Tax=Tetracentron sinense TaxID=13715 RepID=A0A834ZC77_TETSI|nr:hypothetical protein HHK36_011094 [Tetracentron sinense]
MEVPMKYISLVGLLVFVSIAGLERVEGAGECAKGSAESETWKLAPCAKAAQDEHAQVSGKCCAEVKRIGENQSLSCLCAAMLSQNAKLAGINPAIAMTIPKRCNIVDRPVGYKCGAYTLP